MRRFYEVVCLFLLVSVGLNLFGSSDTDQEDLIDALFSNPQFLYAQLSPNGQYLASLSHYRGKRSVLVLDLNTKEINGVTVSRGDDVSSFQWIDEDHFIYHVAKWEIYTKGIYIYSVSKRRAQKILDPYESGLLYRGVVDPMVHHKDKFALKITKGHYTKPPDLYVMNPISLSLRKMADNPGEVSRYIVDEDGNPLFALGWVDRKPFVLQSNEGEGWQLTDSFNEEFKPVDMLPGNRYLLTELTNGEGFRGVNLLDLKTGEFPNAPRFMPGYDLLGGSSSPIIDNMNGYVIGLHYHREKPGNFWFDQKPREIESLIAYAFPDHNLQFLGYNPQSQCVYYTISSDTLPPAIFQVDLQAGKFARVYNQFPEATGLDFRPMQPVSFRSGQDGPLIHGYLTLPEGPGPHPTVMLIHGGPHVRDTWGFNPEVQFFALNGYAVMQVNYRGSAGYGSDHALSSLGEVAALSVEDVIQGAKWMIEEGVADPERLAIMGGSFGGFISLAAAAREPSLWSAVIGYAGVYDLNALYKQDSRRDFNWVDDFFVDYDEDLYSSLSPVHLAAGMEAPVLIIHGKNDQRVRVSQAKSMIRALKKEDKQVDSLFIGWGVHGLPEEKYRKKFFLKIISFLDEHM
ncbi:S9 family peptidase [Puniceicoccales bacterium CK1056]|uniref:S9 family peptidase n=1 Tax=Oceanipulchritudo coccoides TaxID=2706888 RepID=A0A6B2M4J0_9BACT|nr:alpha/beta fold hydrolase [Oceanipulchritudo coccoides]NDV62755.1 S9 family peptidase [Oceanipulchritudo coccoides]